MRKQLTFFTMFFGGFDSSPRPFQGLPHHLAQQQEGVGEGLVAGVDAVLGFGIEGRSTGDDEIKK